MPKEVIAVNREPTIWVVDDTNPPALSADLGLAKRWDSTVVGVHVNIINTNDSTMQAKSSNPSGPRPKWP